MVFLDINTFFSAKAGGIRTYHQAKIEWFRKHAGHHYALAFPGPAGRIRAEHPRVTLLEAYGPAVTGDPDGYRLLLDYWKVFRFLRKTRPDLLEAGDPWLTGLFCLTLRKLGLFRGKLVSFYHSDPVPSYFVPWAARGRGRGLKKILARLLAALFYRLQRGYDLTAVSSRAMESALRARGVARTAHLPFGVPAVFLEDAPALRPPARERRLLYAGRLDREKGVDLLLAALPKLLALGNVYVTVAGRGACAEKFAAVAHPNFRHLGFVEDRARMKALYDEHDVLLAPGPFETFGLGVLEAMARGLAVVGPDLGGTGELLREAGAAWMFPAGDADAFLKAAEAAAAAPPEALQSERDRSRQLAERYGTWDDAVGRMVERFRALAEGK